MTIRPPSRRKYRWIFRDYVPYYAYRCRVIYRTNMLTCTGHISALPRRPLVNTLGSGQGGAFILLLQLFMAITSTGSAEIIAVPSLTVRTFLRTAPKYSPELALFHRVCTAGCVDDLRDKRLADLVKRVRTSRAALDLVKRCSLRVS